MGAFNYDYQWFPVHFQRQPPIDIYVGQKIFQQTNEQIVYYNNIFESFLEQCFAITLQDLIPAITYVVNFFGLPLTFELPAAAQNDQDGSAMVNYIKY